MIVLIVIGGRGSHYPSLILIKIRINSFTPTLNCNHEYALYFPTSPPPRHSLSLVTL